MPSPSSKCIMLLESLRYLVSRSRVSFLRHATQQRSITSTSPSWSRKMPDRPKLVDEDQFTEVFLCGSGPGGQKIVAMLLSNSCSFISNYSQNKTASAVQLKHLPTGLVLKVQATRSRSQNRKIAREMLAEKVDEMTRGKESRVAVVRDVKIKRKSSAAKKTKRKYRALDELKAAQDGEGAENPGQDRKEKEPPA